MSRMNFDVAIIGAGPAGSSAAITLARDGANVLLLERGRFPRHKVCGEFVSAESLALLQSLLDTTALAGKSRLSIGKTRIFIDGQVITADIDPPAASITRFDLDLALWNAARASGVDCRAAHDVSAISFEAGCFLLRTAGETFTARAVLDATGRWSRLRGDKPPVGPKWLGLKCHFREQDRSSGRSDVDTSTHRDTYPPSVDLYFFDHGYCGVQPITDGVVNACAMVRSDIATSLNDAFALNTALATRAQSWTPLFDPITTAPLVFRPPQPLRWTGATSEGSYDPPQSDATNSSSTHKSAPILCIGDAAAFIDPFAGDGISLAVRTGVAAAESLAPFLRDVRSNGVQQAGILINQTLLQAAAHYESRYQREFSPILASAARVRSLLNQPRLLRSAALTAMRLPFVANYVIRKTRTA